ncbi:MAG: hypothetical protein HYZ27_10100 [Deltaproteobacteria bacterium]|nr:hypothetical protein [Deltaproteobacteria bacterium]
MMTFGGTACEKDGQCLDGTTLVDGQCVPATTAPPTTAPDTSTGDATSDAPPDDSASAPDSDACAPACDGRTCGPDGCGGLCGTCTGDQFCTPEGTCYTAGCVARCADKRCGSDGCGGTCGTCDDPAMPFCADGACAAECVPDCIGAECGDDGCGGSCGTCQDGHLCSEHGHCVPNGWTCDPASYDARDACDCGCGVADTDCEQAHLALVGCGLFETCVSGACTARVPAAWTCADLQYEDGYFCDCDCGAPDPDCARRDNPVLGCAPTDACAATGTCTPCVPDCADRKCGGDGCGGVCGSCGNPDPSAPETVALACVDGQCVPGCDGDFATRCAHLACGDDGCGGSCGTCEGGAECVRGQCVVPPEMSCRGRCGIDAPGGCSCNENCAALGNCCPDVVAAGCLCLSDCKGRSCGDDGCGGNCGYCDTPELPYCGGDGQCGTTCTRRCEGRQCGDDGCGGSCGGCIDGTCNGDLCIPSTWTCPAYYYGEGVACDCSCGAPDPDCTRIGFTTGCPEGVMCAAAGFCAIGFCGSDDHCDAPAWCVGLFPTGDGSLRGVCQAPNPAGGAPGTVCVSPNACATEVCAAARCRRHCQQDRDCASGQTCIGLPIVQALSGAPLGIAAVCDDGADITGACAKQADCSGGGHDDARCLALIHPTTLAPMLRCGVPEGGNAEGAVCDAASPCAIGLVCADGHCGRACPGGAADCPADEACKPVLLHAAVSASPSDDVSVYACSQTQGGPQ